MKDETMDQVNEEKNTQASRASSPRPALERALCCQYAIATQDGPIKEGKELSCKCGNRYRFNGSEWKMINPFQSRPLPQPIQERDGYIGYGVPLADVVDAEKELAEGTRRPCAKCGQLESHYTSCPHNHGYSSGAYAVLDSQRIKSDEGD